jgi:hypothetical protein
MKCMFRISLIDNKPYRHPPQVGNMSNIRLVVEYCIRNFAKLLGNFGRYSTVLRNEWH